MQSLLRWMAQQDGQVLSPESVAYIVKLNHAEPTRSVFYGEEKYLKSLWVFWSREDGDGHAYLSIPSPSGPETESFNWGIKEKIKSVLGHLKMRERRILVQFWAANRIEGGRCLLTAIDQPFGLVVYDTQLYNYRKICMVYEYLVDVEREENLGPPARVFQTKMPEWTPNVSQYSTNFFPQLDYALSCNIRGYLAFPVLEPSGHCCVGVLELLMTSDYLDYTHEVNQVCRALQDVGLKSSEMFDLPNMQDVDLRSSKIYDHPNMQIYCEGHEFRLVEMLKVLEVACENHKLPLAQTWVLSEHCSFVAYDSSLKKTCASFDVSCIGQVCMSTTGVPFYVADSHMWRFRKACTEHHLQEGQGVVGRALSLHGLCFCRDVTQFSKSEYPLVYFAQMYGLTSCFAICLRSTYTGNDEYMVEFFLPPSITNFRDQKNLVECLMATLRQHLQSFKVASGEELGEDLSVEVLKLSEDDKLDSFQISQTTRSPTKPKTLQNGGEIVQLDSFKALQNGGEMVQLDPFKTLQNGEMVQQDSLDLSLTMEADAISNATNFMSVQPSETAITFVDKNSKEVDATSNATNFMSVEQSETAATFAEKKHSSSTAYSAKKNVGKTSERERRKNVITFNELKNYFGKRLEDVAKILGVSRSTLKRICRENGILRWPTHKKIKNNGSFPEPNHVDGSVQGTGKESFLTLLLESPTSGLVGSTPPTLLNQFSQENGELALPAAEVSKEAVSSVTESLVSGQPETLREGSLVENAGNSKNMRHIYPSAAAEEQIPECISTDEQAAVNVTDRLPHVTAMQDGGIVTIKAKCEEDTVKFSLLRPFGKADLEQELEKRLKLKVGNFSIRYTDEDEDLILIRCDEDLQFLNNSSSSAKVPIRMFVKHNSSTPQQ